MITSLVFVCTHPAGEPIAIGKQGVFERLSSICRSRYESKKNAVVEAQKSLDDANKTLEWMQAKLGECGVETE